MGKPNIVFITIDACRARALGCYGFPKNVSPNIDALAKKGTRFTQAYSSHIVTDFSRVSFLGGRHLVPNDKLDFIITQDVIDGFFDTGGKFLQEILREQGYSTYSCKELSGWRSRGFDYVATDTYHKKTFVKKFSSVVSKIPFFSKLAKSAFYMALPKKVTDGVRRTVRGKKETKEALSLLKNHDRDTPFFMYLEYKNTHMPYGVPEPFASRFRDVKDDRLFLDVIKDLNFSSELMSFYKTVFDPRENIADIIGRYYGAIAYIDSMIGRFVEGLKKQGLYEDTIIVLLSDHGESLTEHDIFFEHCGLYDVTTHVPLIFSGKGINASIGEGFVQLEDVIPTVLSAAGISYAPDSFDGSDILSGKRRDFVFMEESYLQRKQSIRDSRYKFIMAASKKAALCRRTGKVQGGVVELYDLVNDPDEKHNLVKEKQEVVVKMATRLRQKVADLKQEGEKRRIAVRLKSL